jgi:hypothetical protein
MSDALKFKAEVIQVSSKKTASLDVTYRLVLEAGSSEVLSLGTLDGDQVVDVTVEVGE